MARTAVGCVLVYDQSLARGMGAKGVRGERNERCESLRDSVNLLSTQTMSFLHEFLVFFFGRVHLARRFRARISPGSTRVGRRTLASLQGHLQSARGRCGVACCGLLLAPTPRTYTGCRPLLQHGMGSRIWSDVAHSQGNLQRGVWMMMSVHGSACRQATSRDSS